MGKTGCGQCDKQQLAQSIGQAGWVDEFVQAVGVARFGETQNNGRKPFAQGYVGVCTAHHKGDALAADIVERVDGRFYQGRMARNLPWRAAADSRHGDVDALIPPKLIGLLHDVGHAVYKLLQGGWFFGAQIEL